MLERLTKWWNNEDSNPYSTWDTSLNPRYWVWERYREPVSSVSDERLYLQAALTFLETHGVLIYEHLAIEDEAKPDEDDFLPMYSDQRGRNFWYKHNLVSVLAQDDGTYKLEFYRPASQPSVHEEFKEWVVKRKGDSKVSILIKKNGGLVANKVAFKPPVIDDLELNYGTGFTKTHERMKGILDEGGSSLFMISGPPGTGKSNYLKYLSSIVDRDFVFISPGLAGQLSSPDFISLLMDKKGSVLILEDAEGAVKTRGSENSDDTAVSSLLNITSGFLGDVLSISVIVTTNASETFTDPAMLRKGRLSMKISMEALSIEDAKRLAAHLGKNIYVTRPMTLAEIYGFGVETGHSPREPKSMGFHTLFSTPNPDESEEKVGFE